MTPTASKLALLNLCAWWAQPHVQAPELATTRYALLGTALHALVEKHGDAPEALAPLTESEAEQVRQWYAAWSASEWADVEWLHEVAFAYNPQTDTARVLGRGREQYDRATTAEFCGTADLVYVDRENDLVWVPDIKTGYQPNLGPVSENLQLRFLGLAAARAYGVSKARVLLLCVDEMGVRATEHDYDALDLGFARHELIALLGSVQNAEPRPGAHCADRYCPAVTVCPTSNALVRKAAPVEYPLAPPESPEHALWLRDGAKVLETIAEQWRAWAREYALKSGGVREGDGKVWKKTERRVESIVFDGPGAAEAMNALRAAGLGAAIEVKTTASKADLSALVAQRDGLKGKALREKVEEVLVQLRVAGCVRERTEERFETRKDGSEG